jgi:hypothetical protein
MRGLRLGSVAAVGIGRLRTATLLDGSWFERLTRAQLRARADRVDPNRWERRHPGLTLEQRANREVAKASRRGAAAGALAALVTSGGELATLATEGLAAPIGLPAALVSIGLEAAYQALLQLQLVLDLGALHGTPFGADDAGEIAALFALAHGTGTGTRGPEARLAELESGAVAAGVGRALLMRSLAQSAVPVLGLAISAYRGLASAATLGSAAQRHLRFRRAAAAALAPPGPDPALVVEGVWLLAAAGGRGDARALPLCAAVLRALTPEQRRAAVAGGPPAATAWLERLRRLDRERRPALLELLCQAVAAGGTLAPEQAALLGRVGQALGHEIDLARVERLCAGRGPAPDGPRLTLLRAT